MAPENVQERWDMWRRVYGGWATCLLAGLYSAPQVNGTRGDESRKLRAWIRIRRDRGEG